MRPRLKSPNGTPVFAQQVKIVDPRRDRERKSNENKSSRQQFGSFETRDESEYSDTTSDSDSERIPQWSSHQSELSECFESDGVDDSSSALTFDRDIQKRHRTACKQMRVSSSDKKNVFYSIIKFHLFNTHHFFRSRLEKSKTRCSPLKVSWQQCLHDMEKIILELEQPCIMWPLPTFACRN